MITRLLPNSSDIRRDKSAVVSRLVWRPLSINVRTLDLPIPKSCQVMLTFVLGIIESLSFFSIMATDEYGSTSQAVSEPVAISGTPQLQNGVLAIPGTASTATLTLTPTLPSGASTYSMKVTSTIGTTTTDLGTFAVPTGEIEVYGYTGADTVVLDGTSNDDAFTLGDGNVSEIAAANTADATPFTIGLNAVTALTLDGNGGSDSLTGPNQTADWDITGTNSGTINGTTTFTRIANLIGGTGNNTFAFATGCSLSGTVTGGGGTNTLDFSAQATPVTVTEVASSTNKATGTGGWTNIQTVIGSSTATNTLAGGDTDNSWDITGANAGTLNGSLAFSRFQDLKVGPPTIPSTSCPADRSPGTSMAKPPPTAWIIPDTVAR